MAETYLNCKQQKKDRHKGREKEESGEREKVERGRKRERE